MPALEDVAIDKSGPAEFVWKHTATGRPRRHNRFPGGNDQGHTSTGSATMSETDSPLKLVLADGRPAEVTPG